MKFKIILMYFLVCGVPLFSQTILTPKDGQVYQRDSEGFASIPVSVMQEGTMPLEAQWHNGNWTPLVNEEGIFVGVLEHQYQGQGFLKVRPVGEQHATDSVFVGIGDVFVIAGQSNAEGRAIRAQSFTHQFLKASAFNEADMWVPANDPMDTGTRNGSPWPLVATKMLEYIGVPVAFITTATGGTTLVHGPWQPTTGVLYMKMLEQIHNSGVNGVKAILWHQGENDVNHHVGREEYRQALDSLANAIARDVPGAPKLVVAQIGYKTTGGATREALDNIRLAQSDSWSESANVWAGPSTYDIGPLSDGVHFRTDHEIETLAERWWVHLRALLYEVDEDSAPFRSPRLQMATIDSSRQKIKLQFYGASGITLVEPVLGLRVLVKEEPVLIADIQLAGDTVIIMLDQKANDSVFVSLGSGNDMGGLYDRAYDLPVEPFVRVFAGEDQLEEEEEIVTHLLEERLEEISIFPNPSSHQSGFMVEGAAGSEFFLYTISGRIVHQQQLRSVKETIVVAAIPSGMYIAKLSKQDRTVIRRVIVQ